MTAVTSFLYLHCRDLGEMRSFYTDAVGLAEIYASDEDRTVGYRIGTLQLTLHEDRSVATVDGWANQLGWEGGTATGPSWGIGLDPAAFRRAVNAIEGSSHPTFRNAPEWMGYRSYPVRDPMGNTVEITCAFDGAFDDEPPTRDP